MNKTICKVGNCELRLNIDKHGIWFNTIAPNYSNGVYNRNPIKQLLMALNDKSNVLLKVEKEIHDIVVEAHIKK